MRFVAWSGRNRKAPLGRSIVAPLVVALVAALLTVPASQTASAAASTPSRFVPVTPCRLLDTRTGSGALPPGGSIDVNVVSDACHVPSNATAAAVTLAVDHPQAAGYASAWPAGNPQPTTSVVNYRADEVIANFQLLQIGQGGRISLYTSAAANLILDVTGYFVPAPGGSSDGRFVPVSTHRLIDTRQSARPAPGAAVRVDPDVPGAATAVAVNVTTTGSSGPGFFTAYAAGTDRPLASVLNTDRSGQTRAASLIVPVNAQGFDVYTSVGDHVIVDIVGYFTGPTSPSSTAGLFVASVPVRLVDTRLAAGAPRLWDHGARAFPITQITGGAVAAVALNVTMVQTEDPGYVTAGPARVDRPLTSTVNADAAQMVVANSAITEVSTAGVMFTTLEATHLVVDVTGWFTGSSISATGAAPVNTPPPDRKVTIITDSAMAGVRWNGALAGLQGFVVDHRMESCRRLVQASCRGREGYAPRNVIGELAVLPAVGPEDVLVIATGYDDWYQRFSSDFDTVIAAARQKGFHHIAWVTYRSDVSYGLRGYYETMNSILRTKVASGDFPEVRIWDYELYTTGSAGWFTSDGIHLTTLGAWASADWISRHVRAFDDRPCPQPMRPGIAPDDPCPNPDELPATVGYPDIRALYDV